MKFILHAKPIPLGPIKEPLAQSAIQGGLAASASTLMASTTLVVMVATLMMAALMAAALMGTTMASAATGESHITKAAQCDSHHRY